MEYDKPFPVQETTVFSAWLQSLRDDDARARIKIRVARLARGLAGDVSPVGSGVSEMRIDSGPGYRVYYRRSKGGYLLLNGGHKGTQARDILIAMRMEVEDD